MRIIDQFYQDSQILISSYLGVRYRSSQKHTGRTCFSSLPKEPDIQPGIHTRLTQKCYRMSSYSGESFVVPDVDVTFVFKKFVQTLPLTEKRKKAVINIYMFRLKTIKIQFKT